MNATVTGPLAGLKVLDFSTLLPGPFATLLLADLGAEVIRVEAPDRPDLLRMTPPFDGSDAAWHSLVNRNKRSLALDLKKPGASEVIFRLVRDYDIVVESFRPGVMDRLGIGYAALCAANPRLIYCAVTGFGQTGPLRERAAHDLNLLALAGILQHMGRRDGGPLPLGVPVADLGSAFAAVMGILAAVIRRDRTGAGEFVDVSMLDTALAWNALAVAHFLVGGDEPQREGMLLNGGGYYDVYRTADGRYLSVASLEPKFWLGFCAAIGRDDLAPAGFDTRPEAQARLKQELAAAIGARPLAEWRAIFAAADVCVEPVLSVGEAVAQAHVRERGMIVDVPKAGGGSQPQVGAPVKFAGSTPAYNHTGATLGEHTDAIMGEAGYSSGDTAAMRAAGFFG